MRLYDYSGERGEPGKTLFLLIKGSNKRSNAHALARQK